jgi:hypothetical protein
VLEDAESWVDGPCYNNLNKRGKVLVLFATFIFALLHNFLGWFSFSRIARSVLMIRLKSQELPTCCPPWNQKMLFWRSHLVWKWYEKYIVNVLPILLTFFYFYHQKNVMAPKTLISPTLAASSQLLFKAGKKTEPLKPPM